MAGSKGPRGPRADDVEDFDDYLDFDVEEQTNSDEYHMDNALFVRDGEPVIQVGDVFPDADPCITHWRFSVPEELIASYGDDIAPIVKDLVISRFVYESRINDVIRNIEFRFFSRITKKFKVGDGFDHIFNDDFPPDEDSLLFEEVIKLVKSEFNTLGITVKEFVKKR